MNEKKGTGVSSEKEKVKESQSRSVTPLQVSGWGRHKSSTQPSLPPPSQEEDPVSSSTTLEDQVHDFTTRFDAD